MWGDRVFALDRGPETCKKNYLRYKSAMKGFAEVLQVRHGNAPRNVGRATSLPSTIDYTTTAETFMLQQVEVLDIEHKPMCRYYQSYHLERPDQRVICCGIYINAWGQVLPGLGCDMDYDQQACLVICNVWEPIFDKVLEYNRAHGRHHCTYCSDLRVKAGYIAQVQDTAKTDRENALTTAPSAQDEPSAEPMYIGDIRRSMVQFLEWDLPEHYKKIEKEAQSRDYLTVQ